MPHLHSSMVQLVACVGSASLDQHLETEHMLCLPVVTGSPPIKEMTTCSDASVCLFYDLSLDFIILGSELGQSNLGLSLGPSGGSHA